VIEWASDPERAASAAEAIMRALPGWFGFEEPLVAYAEAAKTLPTLVAREGARDVGFLTIKQHTPQSSEILAMGVLPELHRRGIGRALIEAAVDVLDASRTCLLQVKTLGPSHPSESYARTRLFYETLRFVGLEETTAIWGPDNPCLIMVKTLG
jgi:GNAT superfamily N-acetyltransferase